MRLQTIATAVAVAGLIACRPSPAPGPPSNQGPGGAIAVKATDALGWLAVAPVAEGGERDWQPDDRSAMAFVPAPVDGLRTGTEVTVVGARGPVTARVGAAGSIAYGCDEGRLEVVAIAGEARLPAGVAWVLPPSAPASWQVRAVAIEASAVSASRRDWRLDDLAIELIRTDDTHARLAIRDGARQVGAAMFEKTFMDGAELGPIVLTERQPGVPEPAAAFAFAPGGPWLLVLAVPGYEGLTLASYLVDRDRLTPVPGLTTYLYQCAF